MADARPEDLAALIAEAERLLKEHERDPEKWTEDELHATLRKDFWSQADAALLAAAPRLVRALLEALRAGQEEHEDAKRWLNDAGRAYAPCIEHQPDAWEGDGTCVICEGQQLKAENVQLRAQLAQAQEKKGWPIKFVEKADG